ncbi:MAG: d(CMP) kinase [Pseudomonadota bacterium]
MAFTVAIDGPAASGKGTVARAVAKRFDFAHLDTGLLYRATGRKFMLGADAVEAARSLVAEDLETGNLRGADVAQAASKVAAIAEVRAELLSFQCAFARRDGGAVLDGRDIGTVICPEAEVKLFITASNEVRARRRFQELSSNGAVTDYETVFDDLLARDARDSARGEAPLRAAKDALWIDTTELTIAEAIETASEVVEARYVVG